MGLGTARGKAPSALVREQSSLRAHTLFGTHSVKIYYS